MSESKIIEHDTIKQVQFFSSPDSLAVYSDASLLSLAAEEAVLRFGLRNQNNPTQAKDVVTIYVALPHLKRIAIGLGQLVQQYEELFGIIEQDPMSKLTEKGKERLNKDNQQIP